MPDLRYANVKWPGDREYPDKFTPGATRKCMTIVYEDTNEEEKVYFKTGRQPHESLQKGERIALGKEPYMDKMVTKIYQLNDQSPSPELPSSVPVKAVYTPPTMTELCFPEQEAMDEVERLTTIYFIVMNAVAKEAAKSYGELSEESIRTIATSLYIQLNKEFKLNVVPF